MTTPYSGNVQIRLALAGLILLLAMLLMAAAATLGLTAGLREAGGGSGQSWKILVFLAVLAVVLLCGAVLSVRRSLTGLSEADELPEPERSSTLFGRHLVGIGFALLTGALVNVVVVAILTCRMSDIQEGLAHADSKSSTHLWGDTFDAAQADGIVTRLNTSEAGVVLARLFGRSETESFVVVMLLVVSTLVALLGALFFFATSMWTKMQNADREPFDRSLFWAGLWFRIGEAVVFSLVFSFMLRLYAPDQYLLLPLASLLVGMFLKSGEQLVSGLANRFFAAFAALLPIDKAPTVTIRMFQSLINGLPETGETRQRAIGTILDAITALRGVDRAAIDTTLMLRVRYDPDKTTVEDIKQTVQMLGYSLTLLSS